MQEGSATGDSGDSGSIPREIAEYAAPLTDATDGSPEQIEHAFALATYFYTVGHLGTEEEQRASLELAAADVAPEEPARSRFFAMAEAMLERHREMFPNSKLRRADPRTLLGG